MNTTAPSVPSEFARMVVGKAFRFIGFRFNEAEHAGIARQLDAELQEVREVLAEVIREHDDPMSDYGCTTHTTERARRLLSKLRIEP